jgi:hypothetical protein
MPSVIATGDLLPQRPFRAQAAGVALLADGDVAFGNVEGPLTDRRAPADTVAWVRADPALAAEIAAAGVAVATVANNHAADFGLDGLGDTIAGLRAAGVRVVGGGRDLGEALAPAVVAAGGLRLAFVGLAATLPNGCAAGEGRAGVAPVRVLSRFVVDPVVLEQNPGMAPYVETVARPEDVERACAAVAAARRQADVVVVGVHWGVPDGWLASFQSELADYQRPLGHALVDAGADAVIGHHPHVLHGIELRDGRPIAYSLGNFLFHTLVSGELVPARPYPPYDFTSLRNRLGGVLRLHWRRPGPPERVELAVVELDAAGDPAPAGAAAAAPAVARVNGLSERFGVAVAGGDAVWREVAAVRRRRPAGSGRRRTRG